MSIAAKIRLRKLEAIEADRKNAAAQREQIEADRLQRRSERLAQPFDHDVTPPAPVDHGEKVSAALISRQRKLARIAVEDEGAEGLAPEREATGEGATEYELLLAALGADEAALKKVSGTERKEAMKASMIGQYDAHVDATLAAALDTGKAVQDEIVAMMMIWRFDIGDWDRGLDIAEHMLRHGLRLPSIKNFLRTPATIICENVAEAGLRADAVSKEFDIGILHRAAQLTSEFDMPDQVRAKMAKATALHLVRQVVIADADPELVEQGKPAEARRVALGLFCRALELDKSSGVKKQIECLESWLKKHGAAIEIAGAGDENAAESEGKEAEPPADPEPADPEQE